MGLSVRWYPLELSVGDIHRQLSVGISIGDHLWGISIGGYL